MPYWFFVLNQASEAANHLGVPKVADSDKNFIKLVAPIGDNWEILSRKRGFRPVSVTFFVYLARQPKPHFREKREFRRKNYNSKKYNLM